MKPGRHRKGSKTRNLQGRTKGLETNFAEDEDDQKNGSKNSKPSLADTGIDPNSGSTQKCSLMLTYAY